MTDIEKDKINIILFLYNEFKDKTKPIFAETFKDKVENEKLLYEILEQLEDEGLFQMKFLKGSGKIVSCAITNMTLEGRKVAEKIITGTENPENILEIENNKIINQKHTHLTNINANKIALYALIVAILSLSVMCIADRNSLKSFFAPKIDKINQIFIALFPKKNKQYTPGWYGFDIKSEYEYALLNKLNNYSRLHTNKNITFNELCKSINKKCTTTITAEEIGFMSEIKEDPSGCESNRTPDTIAYCE